MLVKENDENVSQVSMALAQIMKGIKPLQLAILTKPQPMSNTSLEDDDFLLEAVHLQKHLNNFLQQLHKFHIKSVLFYDVTLFFQFIENSLLGSTESVNLMFCKPYELTEKIYERRLAHRLSLFIFYWGAKQPPTRKQIQFLEPLRVIVITRPRKNAFRIYYNQAQPSGNGLLRLVSWYDGDNLDLNTDPLLPMTTRVYSNFQGRVFRVPVFHSPPWFWVNYENETQANATDDLNKNLEFMDHTDMEFKEVEVIGGRDHHLLQLLAKHMNFEFVYIETPGRTQGTLRLDNEANDSFTGGIGLLQNGLADFFLGDVSLSWERRKAIEFSFFTLADSGAFATHAPRRLNEALAIIRPFKADVWPYIVLTVIISGPIFYLVIITPYKWKWPTRRKLGQFHLTYIKEITPNDRVNGEKFKFKFKKPFTAANVDVDDDDDDDDLKMPNNLFDKCFWFTVQLFLKQSCKEFYHGYRAKFLTIVYWIAGTYVLADVYSAQLTSQFARPAHEPPINTLQQLQRAMIQDGYQLFVEKESSSLEMLENGTEIFRQLYALMKLQNPREEGYLIDSMETGIQLIADGNENKVVLGGRETLYFNLKQHGLKKFQLSHKLYTRYSAIAVQIGCPFLDSLNNVLIHLFEGGILDKMTTAEYELQSRLINKKTLVMKPSIMQPHDIEINLINDGDNDITNKNDNSNNNKNNGQENPTSNNIKKPQNATTTTSIIQPLNLLMLQGAFIVLMVGYSLAGFILLLELFVFNLFHNMKKFNKKVKYLKRKFWRIIRSVAMRFFIRLNE